MYVAQLGRSLVDDMVTIGSCLFTPLLVGDRFRVISAARIECMECADCVVLRDMHVASIACAVSEGNCQRNSRGQECPSH